MKLPRTLLASLTLIGATIGIGVLALPYSFGTSGVVPAIFLLVLAFILTLILNTLYVEILLHVKGKHQLAGYAGKFFGKKGQIVATVSLLVGAYGACLAYIIQGGVFLHTIVPVVSPFYFSLLFFFIISLVGLLNLKVFSTVQSIMVGILLLLITLLCITGLPYIQPDNYSLIGSTLGDTLLPYGVLLFAFAGYSIIPEMGEITAYQKTTLKRAVIGGTIVVGVVYLIFPLLVLGISGNHVSEDAVTGLTAVFGADIVRIVAFVALLPVTTSFISLSRVTQDMFIADLGMARPLGWFLALYPPLILFLTGRVGIVKVLEISGGITAGLTGVLLVAMYLRMRAQKKSSISLQKRILYYAVMSIFVIGIGYEVLRSLH